MEQLTEKLTESPRDRQVGGSHYHELGIQPWAALESWLTAEEYAGYLKATAIAYLARCNLKGGLMDIKKANHTLEEMIRFMDQLDPPEHQFSADVETPCQTTKHS